MLSLYLILDVDELEKLLVDDELEELLSLSPTFTPVKNQLKTSNIDIIDSAIGKWSVEKYDDISSNSNKSHCSMLVKKQLFIDNTKGNKSGTEYTNSI